MKASNKKTPGIIKSKATETEYGKLLNLLSAYEKILHPDIFKPIMNQVAATYEESKKNAYAAAKISDDALWVEAKIIEMKARHSTMSVDKKIDSFFMKCFYKELLQKFNGKPISSEEKLP